MVVVRPLAMLRIAVRLSWWSSTICLAEPGEIGLAGDVGDHMVGEELMVSSTRGSMVMLDMI
jgi:hypothetical protein